MFFAVGTRKDPNISQDIVRNMKYVIPPIQEQTAIATYLDAKCSQIDQLISLKESKIEKLQQYKRSLIYEYVTGKKEVVWLDTDFKDIKKQYNELKALWGTKKSRNLSNEEALRYQDVLELLQERGYIMNLRVDGANLYTKRAEWDGFQDWLKQQIKTSRSLSRREWLIAIVGAGIGALLGQIPTIINLLTR